MASENGDKAWEHRKDVILFWFGIAGLTFVMVIMPLLGYVFHVEYLIACLAVLGIPLARWGDRK